MFQLNKDTLAAQPEVEVNRFIQERLELIMREEIKNFLTVEHLDSPNARNGYYGRSLDTRHGRIKKLKVPRDRRGQFKTRLFPPYSRRDNWLEEAVISMYKGGMSTREVAQFIERMVGTHYSPTTISNITITVLEDVDAWRKRPLRKR